MVAQLIGESFDAIASAGKRYESVATSKMLNIVVNPDLFVMWDGYIQQGYSVGRTGPQYAYEFLPKMQRLAKKAVAQVMRHEDRSRDDATRSLTPRNQSLAKVVDEYNYVKFTSGDPRIRTEETKK